MQTPSDSGSKENKSVESLQPEASTEQEWTVGYDDEQGYTVACGQWPEVPLGFGEIAHGRARAIVTAHNSACSLLRQENKTLSEENDGMAAIIQRLEGKGEAATQTPQSDVANEETVLALRCAKFAAEISRHRELLEWIHEQLSPSVQTSGRAHDICDRVSAALREPLISTSAIHSTAPKETKTAGLAGAVTAKLEERSRTLVQRLAEIAESGGNEEDWTCAISEAFRDAAAIALAEQTEKEQNQ